MGVQLIIDGNHVGDVLAQIRMLAEFTNPQPQVEPTIKVEPVKVAEPSVVTEVAEQNKEAAESIIEDGEDKPTKLVGRQHKAEADKMIETGEIDKDIYELLSAAQQQRVDKALTPPANQPDEAEDEDEQPQDALFSDPQPVKGGVTRHSVKDLINHMSIVDGKSDPVRIAAMRDILKKYVPANVDSKYLEHVKEEDLPALADEIANVDKITGK